MQTSARSMMGRRYDLGFNLDSDLLFCSKMSYLVYQTIGVNIGQIQTFKDLLQNTPQATVDFWTVWFWGSIPWQHRTVTPATELTDTQFFTVLSSVN